MKAILPAILLALWAAPLNAQAVPGSIADAQRAYVAGDFKQALRILETLLADRPDDPDLLRRLALVQAASGDFARAQTSIDRAVAHAPEDGDIMLARGHILLWKGDLAGARAQAEVLAHAHPGYPGLQELNAALAARIPHTGWRLVSASLVQSVSSVTFPQADRQTWSRQTASVASRINDNLALAADVEREERRATDTMIAMRATLASRYSAYYVAGSVTPNPDFKESWSIGAGADLALGKGISLALNSRFARYRLTDVTVVKLGLKQEIAPNVSLSADTIHAFGAGRDYSLGGSMRADYSREGKTSYFAVLATYPDTEAGITRQIHAIAAGAAVPLSTRMILRLAGDYESRSNSYQRLSALVGITVSFGR